jgi:predicted metal-dependent hydrolase
MELNYQIVRSAKRRKLTITVERDRSIIVHAPLSTAVEVIDRTIKSKMQWIFEKTRHPQKYSPLPHPPGKEVVNGESALYLGREYKIELMETASGSVEFTRRFLIPESQRGKRKQVLQDWYVAKASEIIPPRVECRAHELGVSVTSVKIVDNRYRWGSCTVNNHVHYNWRLIKAPMFVIDYVIVHELAHLIESNHTPRFWNIVRTKATAAEKAKAWLKEHGQILEE